MRRYPSQNATKHAIRTILWGARWWARTPYHQRSFRINCFTWTESPHRTMKTSHVHSIVWEPDNTSISGTLHGMMEQRNRTLWSLTSPPLLLSVCSCATRLPCWGKRGELPKKIQLSKRMEGVRQTNGRQHKWPPGYSINAVAKFF
jgi:hypothetical protein